MRLTLVLIITLLFSVSALAAPQAITVSSPSSPPPPSAKTARPGKAVITPGYSIDTTSAGNSLIITGTLSIEPPIETGRVFFTFKEFLKGEIFRCTPYKIEPISEKGDYKVTLVLEYWNTEQPMEFTLAYQMGEGLAIVSRPALITVDKKDAPTRTPPMNIPAEAVSTGTVMLVVGDKLYPDALAEVVRRHANAMATFGTFILTAQNLSLVETKARLEQLINRAETLEDLIVEYTGPDKMPMELKIPHSDLRNSAILLRKLLLTITRQEQQMIRPAAPAAPQAPSTGEVQSH